MDIEVKIEIPVLWPGEFCKSKWGGLNFVVGPNGTGKSLLADQIKVVFTQHGLKVRSLSAERLSGFEKSNYNYYSSSGISSGLNISQFNDFKNWGESYGLSTSAFITLRERLDIRVRIEAILSDIFNKRIRLAEEGGFLKPKIQNISRGDEYNLKENECHGLKELITLLTFLYDPTNNTLILDEPELHLHPQFQSYFMQEVRALAGNPLVDSTKKLFLIITHSPYFLDFRTLDDIKNVIVCHKDTPPTFIDSFDTQDEYVLKRFLPRFNTHHKQFFFSPNPVFVEGYTDQQIISLLIEKIGINAGSAGASIIDVGGKDELAVFFRLCNKLKIDARSIADFDAIFRGKLRELIQADPRSSNFFIAQGFGSDISSAIGELERKLSKIGTELLKSTPTHPSILRLHTLLSGIIQNSEKRSEVLDSTLLTILRHKDELKDCLAVDLRADVDYIYSRYHVLLKAFIASKVFIVPNGEVEHYYCHAHIDYLNYGKKDELFHKEFDYILGIDDSRTLASLYADLLAIATQAIPTVNIDLRVHMKYQIIEWIQTLQRAISRSEVVDYNTLVSNATINYGLFNQLFDINESDLKISEDRSFNCILTLKDSVVSGGLKVEFDHKTNPHEFAL